jgi:hypothetical protein
MLDSNDSSAISLLAGSTPAFSPSESISLANPLTHAPHFVGLELVFLACFVLTIRDVVQRRRQGDRYALFQWLVILAYGVAMELIAFNAFPDYAHGQFTVQLYHRKLPLYVTFVYVVFDYTGLKLAERLKLGRFGEAVTAGLAMLLLDVPFDIAGVDARWWVWTSGHDVTQRWLGVPLTSYAWYLIFGAVLAWLCRALKPRIEGRSVAIQVALAPLVAVLVIALGIVGFLPFHALEAVGLPDAAIVLVHAAFAAVIAYRARAGRREAGSVGGVPRELASIAIVLALWHLGVILVLAGLGGAASGGAKVAAASAAAGANLFLFVFTRGAAVPAPGALAGSAGEERKVLTT